MANTVKNQLKPFRPRFRSMAWGPPGRRTCVWIETGRAGSTAADQPVPGTKAWPVRAQFLTSGPAIPGSRFIHARPWQARSLVVRSPDLLAWQVQDGRNLALVDAMALAAGLDDALILARLAELGAQRLQQWQPVLAGIDPTHWARAWLVREWGLRCRTLGTHRDNHDPARMFLEQLALACPLFQGQAPGEPEQRAARILEDALADGGLVVPVVGLGYGEWSRILGLTRGGFQSLNHRTLNLWQFWVEPQADNPKDPKAMVVMARHPRHGSKNLGYLPWRLAALLWTSRRDRRRLPATWEFMEFRQGRWHLGLRMVPASREVSPPRLPLDRPGAAAPWPSPGV